MLRAKKAKFVKNVKYYNYPKPTEFVAAVTTLITSTLALALALKH